EIVGQFLRRGEDELVADTDERRAEVKADVVDIGLQRAVLGEAVGDDVAVVVLLLAELQPELGAREQGGPAQDCLHRLAKRAGLAHLSDEGEGGDGCLCLLLVAPLWLVDDDDAVIGAGLAHQLAELEIRQEAAGVLVELLDVLGVLLAEQLDAVGPEDGQVPVKAGAQQDTLWLQQRTRARLSVGRTDNGPVGLPAAATGGGTDRWQHGPLTANPAAA